jgi:hypothetical protein
MQSIKGTKLTLIFEIFILIKGIGTKNGIMQVKYKTKNPYT